MRRVEVIRWSYHFLFVGKKSLGKVWAAVLLGRPLNALMVFLVTIAGGLLAGLEVNSVVLPALSAAFISMGAQAVNDYFDVEIDRKKSRKKPLVEGTLTLKEARLVWMFYFAVGLMFASLASKTHFLIAATATVLSYIYSKSVQKKKYVGNVLVSALVALSIIYGGIGGEVNRTFLPAAIIFLVNWGREIYKDIVDGEADYPRKISLFHILTEKWAGFLGSYLIFLGVVLSPFPFLLGYLGSWYMAGMGVASLLALYGVAKAIRGEYHRGEIYVKAGMLVAIISLFMGVVL